MNKKLLIPMAAVAIIGAGVYGTARVSAASDPANPQSSLVQKLADTFHLDKAKVQAVFDQDRTDRQAEMESRYEERLTQAVTSGQLTEEQKQTILTEHKKLETERQAAMQSGQGSSSSDRQAAMQKLQQEIQAWSQQTGIDAKWLMPGRGMHGGMGHGMMGPGGLAPSGADTDTGHSSS